ncbi:GIY-YIG nuclease family protein [Vibrio parahaemolyticus]|nr:GIY-YIG nuclease family protein [Vibrio parahaemolyticus]
MLSTYIRDVYKESETQELADAIEDIASAIDTNGWASAGIYCFWNPENNEILYIGLARDLSNRFKEHNGLSLTITWGIRY